MTKQETIKKAWGKLWQQVKDSVNDEGYVHLSVGNNSDVFYDNGDYDYFDTLDSIGYGGESVGVDQYRPKTINGIEHNNGWIKIESESDLPKIRIDGKGNRSLFKVCFVDPDNYVLFDFPRSVSGVSEGYSSKGITHYRPIIKPEPPIY